MTPFSSVHPDQKFARALLFLRYGAIPEFRSFISSGGFPVDLLSPIGLSLSHWACMLRCPEALEALFAVGANPNLKGSGGFTPILRAAQGASLSCLRLCLENGGDPFIRDESGLDCFAWARSHTDASIREELIGTIQSLSHSA